MKLIVAYSVTIIKVKSAELAAAGSHALFSFLFICLLYLRFNSKYVCLPPGVVESRVRESVFTPTNVRQIANLLERGKTREEIADILGVTVGTLKVTCSRLGISLRRPHSPSNGQLRAANGNSVVIPKESRPEKAPVQEAPIVQMISPETVKADVFEAALALQYKGQERRITIPIERSVLAVLALEAEFRSMSVGRLIANMLESGVRMDTF